MHTRSLVTLVHAGLLLLVVTSVYAQELDPLLTPPQNIVLPNANGVPVGPFGGLEGRADSVPLHDPVGARFNPAGLSRAKTAQISGSAGLYQFTNVSASSLPNPGNALEQIPNLVGYSMRATSDCSAGVAIVTTVS